MPFTLSHPAAIVPFRRLVRPDRLPFEAFVVGTMTPDFEYLLRLEPLALLSHSWSGLVLFCLPMGALALALWLFLLRTPLRALLALPAEPHQSRQTTAWWARGLIAVLLGAATHLVWDAFTHRDAWGPVLFPVLRTTAFTFGTLAVPWYNVLQVVSSLVGGAAVLGWCVRYLRSHGAWPMARTTRWRQRTWLALALCALAAGAWNADRRGLMRDKTHAKIVIGRIVIGAMSGFSLALVGYALLARRGVRLP